MHPQKLLLSLAIGAIGIMVLLLAVVVWKNRQDGALADNRKAAVSNTPTSRQKSVIGLYPESKSHRREEKQLSPIDSTPDTSPAHMLDDSKLSTEDNSAPGTLLNGGLQLIQEGHYAEGENAFLQLVRKGSENPTSLASDRWATGLNNYRHETIEEAASYFKRMTLVSSSNMSDEQLKTAQFFVASIYVELTKSSESSKDRNRYSLEAQNEIRAFLEKWPDDLLSFPLRLSLAWLEQSM
ncbi:MAG TPA: hypothetical protein VMW38_29150 [Terriglobia bacterium]|nr:hypothetical protein [Terriglobia bacterium]